MKPFHFPAFCKENIYFSIIGTHRITFPIILGGCTSGLRGLRWIEGWTSWSKPHSDECHTQMCLKSAWCFMAMLWWFSILKTSPSSKVDQNGRRKAPCCQTVVASNKLFRQNNQRCRTSSQERRSANGKYLVTFQRFYGASQAEAILRHQQIPLNFWHNTKLPVLEKGI